ncbi:MULTISPECIES: YbjN domain-containing protein [unclassified Anaerotruncus]|jgi:hypothetical protein|uniref:YbjN domain-containing protein n=1 Tax=unclassified Anaerotruncus TaxID=2641626 RepID=UPI00033C6DE0|nr:MULTISPECIES: YbjN domain-containing protein [unclassified Anaerotruncus]EOS56743.1 hypothetical protein C814_02614 [Anaerotruncus sp. G3(2012)]MCI9161242.1 YbjN domain-containing protein [Anaerotruncus sp.]MCI9236133.1 YbjN domain-containing protein [Anaerotruncus sp.]
MSKSYEAIKQYLDDQEWRYDYREEDEYFIMRMNMQSVDSCTCIIQLKENDDFTVYSIFPLKVAQDKLAAAAEYIARANYGLTIGNFELDFDDGELRYKATAPWKDTPVDPALIDRIVNIGFCMVDRYAPGLLSVLYGNVAPKEAIDKIENSED